VTSNASRSAAHLLDLLLQLLALRMQLLELRSLLLQRRLLLLQLALLRLQLAQRLHLRLQHLDHRPGGCHGC
jgi:hypothetical protein